MVSSGNVDSFKSTMFPDAESWQLQPSITHDNLAIYVRGSPLRFSTSLVCHGCPLSVAFVIVREGLLAGQGHHYKKKRTVNGIFVISEGELGERIRHARDRSTTYRDTQWSRGPSGWSTPCVLVFPIHVNSVSILGNVGGCKKSCVPCHIGTRIALPQACMLCLHREEYRLYSNLPCHDEKYMMCGGREYLGSFEPLYWARRDNNMPPSCGRTCSLQSLLKRTEPGWSKTQAHI